MGLLLLLQHVAVAFEPIVDQVPTKAPTEPQFAFPPVFLPTNPFTQPPQQQVIVPTPFQITFPTDAPVEEVAILPTTAPTAPRVLFTLAPVPTATTPPTNAPSTLAPMTEAPNTAAPIPAAPITAAPITMTPTIRNGQVTFPNTNPPTTGGGGGTSTSPPTLVPQSPPQLQVFPPNGGSIPTIPALTVMPTLSPQTTTTTTATEAPTVAPTSSEPRAIKAMIQGVTMTLTGITNELSKFDQDIFGEEYSAWFDEYFADARRRRRLQSLYGVTEMVSGLDVTHLEETEDGTGTTMTFTHSLDYIALPNLAPPPDEVVLLPFQTPNDRTDLVNTLQRNVESMRGLESVTVPEVIPPVGPEPKKGETWATPSVIAGITGGCALLIGTIAFLLYFCCGIDNGKGSNESTASESPLQQFQFGTGGSEDNVSAFDADNGGGFDGTTKTTGQSTDALSVGNYGEQRYVGDSDCLYVMFRSLTPLSVSPPSITIIQLRMAEEVEPPQSFPLSEAPLETLLVILQRAGKPPLLPSAPATKLCGASKKK